MKQLFKSLSKNYILEHLLFLVLSISACTLYQERLLADSGYYIFRVINSRHFWIEHHRYILALPELLPLLLVRVGVGLKSILVVYALWNVLFFYLIFLVSTYYYKNERAGLLLLLIQTLGIMSGFFVPMFELYYCSALLVLFGSVLYCREKKNKLILLTILAYFILTGHPFGIILLFFVLAIHALEFKKQYLRYYLVFVVLLVLILIRKKYDATAYEQAKVGAFFDNLQHAHYGLSYIGSLFVFMLKYYAEMLFLGLIATSFLIYSKKYYIAAIVALTFIGTLVLINITYYGFQHSRYQEQVYFPLSFVVAYAFVYYVIDKKRNSYTPFFYVLALFIVLIRIAGIWQNSIQFSNRITELKHLIKDTRATKGDKYIVRESDLKYPANWSYPIESMLLSSLHSNRQTVTICTDTDMNFDHNRSKLTPDKYLFRRWEVYSVNSLNKSYFSLDSTSYRPLTP